MITTNVTLTKSYQKIASSTEAFAATASVIERVQYAFTDADAAPAATVEGHEFPANSLVRETSSDLTGYVWARLNPKGVLAGATLSVTKAA